MECCPKLKQLLGNVKLDLGIEVLIEARVFLFAELTDFLRYNILEFLRPFVSLDLILSIN
jgi:hypothetical protein